MPRTYREFSDKPKNSPALIALTVIAGLVLIGLIIGVISEYNKTAKAGAGMMGTIDQEKSMMHNYVYGPK